MEFDFGEMLGDNGPLIQFAHRSISEEEAQLSISNMVNDEGLTSCLILVFYRLLRLP